MSGTMDLKGATMTVSDDTMIEAFVITDSSTGHDGKIIGGKGISLVFDDTAGSGFASAAVALDVEVTGISADHCSMRSASLTPTNRWTMPVPAAKLIAAYTDFRGYVLGFTTGASWSTTNCTWENAVPSGASPYSTWFFWLNQTALLQSWNGTIDSNGFKVYGPPVPINCRINSNPVQQLDEAGNILTLPTEVLIDETSSANINDKMTLPDGTTHIITKVKDVPGATGALVFKSVSLI